MSLFLQQYWTAKYETIICFVARVSGQFSGNCHLQRKSMELYLFMQGRGLTNYVIGWSVTRTQSYHRPKECLVFMRLKVHPSPDALISEVFQNYGL